MKEEQIQTLHPLPGKINKQIALKKYNTIKEHLLVILAKKELTHTDLMEELYNRVKDFFDGGVQWYGEVIKLDLEARKIIERTSTKPVKYKLKTTPEHNERIAKLTFASVYPHYITKVEKKGRTKEELHQVIEWLTGFNNKKLQQLIEEKVTFETFFKQAKLNPNAHLITGLICGYRIEEIENALTKQARYLDKLVDELAKGKKMEKILRK